MVLRELLAARNARFEPVTVTKYSTRHPRQDDRDEIRCVAEIPAQCDLVYEQYGVRYGFSRTDLVEKLRQGLSPIVIVNDVRTVGDLRRMLGPIATSAYIFRSAPSLEKLVSLGEARGAALDEYHQRFQKAQAIHRIYIENIHLFDHVVLNVQSRPKTRSQVRSIVRVEWPTRASGFRARASTTS